MVDGDMMVNLMLEVGDIWRLRAIESLSGCRNAPPDREQTATLGVDAGALSLFGQGVCA